jgi:4-amino-4-deoxy-L-arabinose transferase-like glycosyltransferase
MYWSRTHWMLLVLAALNLAQAAFTPLTPDEAYYRMYAAYPALGYFDHPPAVALLIRIGQMIIGDHPLGIRFCFVLAQIAALWITLFRLLPVGNYRTPTVALWSSIVLLHVYGWVATPDGPLLLAVALFLWAYKVWLNNGTMLSTVGLGLSMAAMLWAKYHGVLVILMVILAYPKLVFRPMAWLAVLIGIVGFAPHLWWQIEHNFPTFKFHLGERSPEPYSVRHTLEFIANQLLLYNPLVLIPVWRNVLKQRFSMTDPFDSAMRVLLIGFPLFFLVMTASVYAEPHWTYITVLPMIYFLSQINGLSKKYIQWTLAGILILVLLARSVVVWPGPYLPPDLYKTHQQAKAILKAADGRKLVIGNSYQLAALCDYYGKQPVVGIYMTDQKTRHNQYTTLNRSELLWQNQPVFVAATTGFNGGERQEIPDCKSCEFWGKTIKHFQFLKDLEVAIVPADGHLNIPLTNRLTITLKHNYNDTIHIGDGHWALGIYCYNKGYLTAMIPLNIKIDVPAKTTIHYQLDNINWPKEWIAQPRPEFVFSLMGDERPHSVNSQFYQPATTLSHIK